MKYQTIIKIIASIVALGVASLVGAYLVANKKAPDAERKSFYQFLTRANAPPEPRDQLDAPPQPIGEERTLLSHPLGFSFEHPTDMTITSFDEGDGEVMLGQGEGHRSFQIFILPFDEEGVITPDRIKKDIPNMVIESPQQVLIGKNHDVTALIFLSESPELGKTREAWFAYSGYLYQVTTHADADSFIGPLLETWGFENY